MRFTHVYYLLLALSALSAFVIPQRFTDGGRPMVATLLTPVAQPARAVAAWATGRFNPPAPRGDGRPSEQLFQENDELRLANVKLIYDLEELRKVNGEREKLGDVRELCTPVAVIGNDPGQRDALAVRTTNLGNMHDGMYVLNDRDVVGTLITGKAGAQVRLVTDPQSRILAYFGSFRRSGKPDTQPAKGGSSDVPGMQFVRVALPTHLIEGTGRGKMICRNIPYADVEKAGLNAGDWVVVDDPACPKSLQGRRLGTVSSIGKSASMMALIEIKPQSDLLSLREVMILRDK